MASTGSAKRGGEAGAWEAWEREHAELLGRATEVQRVLLEAAVRFVAATEAEPILLRMAAFFLLHAGLGLSTSQVGAAVGRTDRAMRIVQALSGRELVESIWNELGRHRRPKLQAEHAGPVAKYLAEHPRCTTSEVAAFVARQWQIAVDERTLRRFFATYGLGVLRDWHDRDSKADRPFSSATPTSVEPFSSCPSR
jgi:transposase